jgi:hypothetical protein
MNPHADKADFPILRSDNISMKKNMDRMIREIIQVLERCSKLETIFSDKEREDNEYLITRVLQFDFTLDTIEDEGHEALLRLFRMA